MSRRPVRPGKKNASNRTRVDEISSEDDHIWESTDATAVSRLPMKKRIITPFRLVILGGLILVGGTIYVQMESMRRDQAAIDLRESLARAEAALVEGDFQVSAEEFKKACLALDILKPNDSREKNIRQRYREATAANGLVAGSMIAAVERLPSRADQVAAVHQNSDGEVIENNWIVLETMVSREHDRNNLKRTVIDCEIVFEEKIYIFEENLPLFEKLSLSDEPQKVVFAAQLSSCRPLETDSNVWKIQIRPKTAFLWTDINSYMSIGFQLDDPATQQEMAELFYRQSRLMGLDMGGSIR